MNFNYSYRAFLITCLLFAIFFLALYSWKLGKGLAPFDPKYDIEYAEVDPILSEEQEDLALSDKEADNIETNKAYNEAEAFLKEGISSEDDGLDNKLAEMDAAIAQGLTNNSDDAIKIAKEKLEETFETTLKSNKTTKKTTQGNNRKTTISYRLKDRKTIALPNPVYTCEGGGKIVISIEVNAAGNVTKATYNKSRSTTTNGCLIDSALQYANTSKFTTMTNKPTQLGTITYNFPGQY